MLVLDIRRLDSLLEQLRNVARADVRAKVALIVVRVVHIYRRVKLARRADSHHHHARLPQERCAARVLLPARIVPEPAKPAREQESQVLISRLRPAVEIVRQRQPVRVKRFHLARVYQVMLVPVRRVVRAGDGETRNAGVIRAAQHIVRHLHILVLIEEVIERLALPALVAQMHHRIYSLEQARVLAAVGVYQISNLHALHLLAARVLILNIHQHHLVALPKSRQQLIGDIPGRPRHKHLIHSHRSHILSVHPVYPIRRCQFTANRPRN